MENDETSSSSSVASPVADGNDSALVQILAEMKSGFGSIEQRLTALESRVNMVAMSTQANTDELAKLKGTVSQQGEQYRALAQQVSQPQARKNFGFFVSHSGHVYSPRLIFPDIFWARTPDNSKPRLFAITVLH